MKHSKEAINTVRMLKNCRNMPENTREILLRITSSALCQVPEALVELLDAMIMDDTDDKGSES